MENYDHYFPGPNYDTDGLTGIIGRWLGLKKAEINRCLETLNQTEDGASVASHLRGACGVALAMLITWGTAYYVISRCEKTDTENKPKVTAGMVR